MPQKPRQMARLAEKPLSEAMQDYLREIHMLQADAERATTSAVAASMGVSPPSASAMLKKLAALGLVEHTPYRGAVLTRAGERIALEVIRHHRLLEQYLSETLGLPIDALHAEADRLEHALSDELEQRIDESLDFPSHDPHGDPIPDAALVLQDRELRTLATLEEGETATILRVPDRDSDLLRYLASLALLPGCQVELRRAEPFGGPLTVRVNGLDHPISRELASQLGVA